MELIKLEKFTDSRGDLYVLEDELKFKIQRIFYIINGQKIRGKHGHYKTTLVIICLNGSVTIELHKPGLNKSITLNNPGVGCIIKPGIWHSLKMFSKNSVVICLASTKYDQKDYFYDQEDSF